MRRNPLGGLTIKAALIIGFGLTLGLWLFTGYRFTQNLAEAERDSADTAARYVQAQERLAALRAQILVASGTARDALLDRMRQPAEESRRLLDDRLDTVADTVSGYVLVMGSADERALVSHLGDETVRFANQLRETLTPAAEARADGRARFRDDVLPRRTALLDATDRLQALNRASFIDYQAGLTDAHSGAEQAMRLRLGLALLCSLGIAIFATLYAARLEKRLVSQLVQDAVKTRALQDLSIKMIRAQEDERRRIARELHDEVGQALTAIKVELSLAERMATGAGGPTALLTSAKNITDGALHSVRDLSQLLHPSVLDDLGLPEAVDGYLREFSKRYAIKTRLELEGMAARLAPDVEVAAYRIIQEALTNVAKHAHATRCTVTLARRDDRCHILVEDDGHGFEAAGLEVPGGRRGLGLIGMRERALQLAGMVSVDSTPGRGTRVSIDLPARVAADSPTAVSAAAVPAVEPS
jgi:signal transduction histidine kinase